MTTKTKEATIHSDPLSSLGDALETAAGSLGDATSNARTSAKMLPRQNSSCLIETVRAVKPDFA